MTNIYSMSAKETYKAKINDIMPKDKNLKYTILEKGDHTYAGQVNDSIEPHGYGVKTYTNNKTMQGIFKDKFFVFGNLKIGDKNNFFQ